MLPSLLLLWFQIKGKVKVLVAQPCWNLCDPMECSLPGFSVHGSLQAKILEWILFSYKQIC